MKTAWTVVRRFADFRGRSSRAEFWTWVAMLAPVGIACLVLDSWVGLTSSDEQPFGPAIGGPVSLLGAVLTAVPTLAAAVRRLHDTGRRAWWLLLPVLLFAGAFLLLILAISIGLEPAALGLVAVLSPVIGALIVAILLAIEGTQGSNRFGADPKDPLAMTDLADVFR